MYRLSFHGETNFSSRGAHVIHMVRDIEDQGRITVCMTPSAIPHRGSDKERADLPLRCRQPHHAPRKILHLRPASEELLLWEVECHYQAGTILVPGALPPRNATALRWAFMRDPRKGPVDRRQTPCWVPFASVARSATARPAQPDHRNDC
jgi:hypothetical protein